MIIGAIQFYRNKRDSRVIAIGNEVGIGRIKKSSMMGCHGGSDKETKSLEPEMAR